MRKKQIFITISICIMAFCWFLISELKENVWSEHTYVYNDEKILRFYEKYESTFTIGGTSVDLQESNCTLTTNTTSKQKIMKVPKVENDGKNDVYVFLEVTVPYQNVTILNNDGTMNFKTDTELFNYDVNPEWIKIGKKEKNNKKNTVTYLYAYGSTDSMTLLKEGQSTTNLFDGIKTPNIVETELLNESEQDIEVVCYAISLNKIKSIKMKETLAALFKKSHKKNIKIYKLNSKYYLYIDYKIKLLNIDKILNHIPNKDMRPEKIWNYLKMEFF